MYSNLEFVTSGPNEELACFSREQIVLDINAGLESEKHMLGWFTHTPDWYVNSLTYCNMLYDKDCNLIAMASSAIQPDNTMKILCHYYVIRKYRALYRSIHQTNIIPADIQYGIDNKLNGVWYSFHAFDKRHQRYSDSQKRLLNGSGVREEHMPFWKQFKYVGNVIYKNVEQEKFYMDLTNGF